jgi:hypothetical protein
VGAQRQHLIGGKDDEAWAGQRGLGMKRQKRIEDGERTLGNAQAFARGADGAEHIPFVDGSVLGCGFGGELGCHMGKRQRSGPKGRRRGM